MNYIEKIKKAIECPQLNNTRYGEWGALTLEQRRYIKRLLDELDSADNYIKNIYLENQKYKEVIDKTKMRISAIIKKYQQKIDNEIDMGSQGDHFKICRYEENIKILKDILKEVE